MKEAMPYYFFVWTQDITTVLAEHDVAPEEFEEVVSNPDCEDISRSTGNAVAFGTASTVLLLVANTLVVLCVLPAEPFVDRFLYCLDFLRHVCPANQCCPFGVDYD